MGFKYKRWGDAYSLDVRDFDSDVSTGTGDEKTRIIHFQGRIYWFLYDGTTGDPIYFYYDVNAQEWSGPFDGPSASWSYESVTYGYRYHLYKMGEEAIIWSGGMTGYYTTAEEFGLIDENGLTEFSYPTISGTSITTRGMGGGASIYNGHPTRMRHGFYTSGGQNRECLQITGPGGPLTVYDSLRSSSGGVDLYFKSISGSDVFMYSWIVDGGFMWYYDDGVEPFTYRFFPASPPLVGGADSGLLYRYYTYPTYTAHPIRVAGNGAYYMHMRDGDTDTDFWALASAPTEDANPYWATDWLYIRDRDNAAYSLDYGDLDGSELAVAIPNNVDPTYNVGLGYYIGGRNRTGYVQDVLYLDPVQPTTAFHGYEPLGNNADAWVGDFGIANKVFFNPTGIPDPDLDSAGPVDHPGEHLYLEKYVRPLGGSVTAGYVDCTSYPYYNPSWNFPGMTDGVYPGFWESFAHDGDDLIIARMPDYSWGALNPSADDVMYSMGRVQETPSGHVVVDNSDIVSGTNTFMKPYTGTVVRQLIGNPATNQLVSLVTRIATAGSQPQFDARIGHITASTWVDDIDFSDSQYEPGLGEDGDTHRNWQIWGIQPVGKCTQMPDGGWVVGATLYFKPWGSTWAWDTNTRDAEFMDTGMNYVPSKWSYLGPIPVPNEPIYRTDLDEWTTNRSVYGSDALLLYSPDGTFKGCLNTVIHHGVDGREFAITRGQNPRIIYRVYRWGVYSDSAEYWGAYADGGDDYDIYMPLYTVYDLFDPAAPTAAPTLGTHHGYVDYRYVKTYFQQAGPTWRQTVAENMYESAYPKAVWPSGSSQHQMRSGRGARNITLLNGGPSASNRGKVSRGTAR